MLKLCRNRRQRRLRQINDISRSDFQNESRLGFESSRNGFERDAMNTRHPTQPLSPAGSPLQPWNMFADFGRQQMAVATEGAGILFRGFETMRKIQEKAAHEAGAQHQAAAEKLKKSCTPNDLLAIQSDLMRFDAESATLYWQQLGAAAMEMQTALLGCATQMADTESLLEAASAFDHIESAVPGLERMFTPKPNGLARKRRSA